MTTILWVIVFVLGGMLMAFTAYAAIVGGIGALTGGRFERCPDCGRHGLSTTGQVHPHGCPPRHYSEPLAHLWHRWPHDAHLRHH